MNTTVQPRSNGAGGNGSPPPDRSPATLHIDLDGASHIFRLHGWHWTGADPVYENGVPHALDFLDAAGVRATFFVIAEDFGDPAKAKLIQEIVSRGHQLASHALTHAPLRDLDPAGKRREIFDSRALITRETGVEPAGFRAPNFSIDSESLRLLAEAGYAWDSSMVAGSRLRMPADCTLLEIPMPAHRPLPFPWHPSYGLVLGMHYFERGLRRHLRRQLPLVLLFHLIDFADPLPAARLSGWSQRLYTLSHIAGARKRERCRRMLDRVSNDFDVVDMDRMLDQARDRRRQRT
jgi:peptidoglycan/xylan/chitin deacetylase (PgdA/CDA1 family)